MAKRTPITVRGNELLAMIAATGVLMLTQDEGAEVVAAGHAVVDGTKVDGDTAAVSLTDAGRAALAAATAPATATSSYAIDTNIPLPTKTGSGRAGRSGGYPFDALEVGASFHVPVPAGKTAKELLTTLSSSLSGARTKYAEEISGETEVVKVRTYKKEGDKFVKDADGKRVVDTETETTRPKTRVTRDFVADVVGENDPKGVGVRVWRKS